jgi:hypothetical protein
VLLIAGVAAVVVVVVVVAAAAIRSTISLTISDEALSKKLASLPHRT